VLVFGEDEELEDFLQNPDDYVYDQGRYSKKPLKGELNYDERWRKDILDNSRCGVWGDTGLYDF
jgi:hypothetical protein